MEKANYQIRKDANFYTLLINGSNSQCPFQSIFPVPMNNGGMGFAKQACSTLCPLAEIIKDPAGINYHLHCGCGQSHVVTECEPSKIETLPTIMTPVR